MLPAEREQSIQTLFLQREDIYDLRAAARLTGRTPRQLRREVAAGRDATGIDGALCFTWRQVAFLALDRFGLAEIHDALGTDAATVLPPLLALRPVTIRLPEYVLRALEMIASDHGQTLDDCLYGELIDFAGAMCSHVEQRIPGYRSAYLYPGRESKLAAMKPPKPPRDVNQNVKRIFGEMIERSEEPPKRGNMKIAPPPAKKNGATK
jgi:hypothetical protein